LSNQPYNAFIYPTSYASSVAAITRLYVRFASRWLSS
jgi:hypothetical protein